MTTDGNSRLTDGSSSWHGPIPTIVYVCEPDAATADRNAERCRGHAEQRAWHVVETVIEGTPDVPLGEREGWRRVMAALGEGAVGIIVTWDTASVAAGRYDFRTLQAAFRAEGAVLVAVDANAGPPPRRSDDTE